MAGVVQVRFRNMDCMQADCVVTNAPNELALSMFPGKLYWCIVLTAGTLSLPKHFWPGFSCKIQPFLSPSGSPEPV